MSLFLSLASTIVLSGILYRFLGGKQRNAVIAGTLGGCLGLCVDTLIWYKLASMAGRTISQDHSVTIPEFAVNLMVCGTIAVFACGECNFSSPKSFKQTIEIYALFVFVMCMMVVMFLGVHGFMNVLNEATGLCLFICLILILPWAFADLCNRLFRQRLDVVV